MFSDESSPGRVGRRPAEVGEGSLTLLQRQTDQQVTDKTDQSTRTQQNDFKH